jgi:hypothetical protein
MNDIVCKRINGNSFNIGVCAYGSTYTGVHNGCTFITTSSSLYTIRCGGDCKGILTATTSTGTLNYIHGYNFTTQQHSFAVTVTAGANFSYMIV